MGREMEGMEESSYSGGNEASGQVPVDSFLSSALLRWDAIAGESSAWMGVHVEVGLVVIAGCYFLLLFCAHTPLFWDNVMRTYLGWDLWE